jgi:tetratricopeptide (TPR) repeat protein
VALRGYLGFSDFAKELVVPPSRRQPGASGGSDRRRGGPPQRGGKAPASGRPQRPQRDATSAGSQRDDRSSRAAQPARDERPSRAPREDRPPRPPEPPLADEIQARDLDRAARAGLRILSDGLAEKIARHLVAAGRAIDDDPELALAHAQYARALAPRLAICREAVGVAAYRAGDFATALSELRAVRRMTGDPSHLPVLADCERGLGRPERALALVRDPDARRLGPAERVELAIVESGARRDRGEMEAAVVALQGPALRRQEVAPWTVRLWYAYAAALADAGRVEEAKEWFVAVASIDDDGETDAEERVNAEPRDPGHLAP